MLRSVAAVLSRQQCGAPLVLTHSALFWQGLLSHSLMSSWHLSPAQPALQMQPNDALPSTQPFSWWEFTQGREPHSSMSVSQTDAAPCAKPAAQVQVNDAGEMPTPAHCASFWQGKEAHLVAAARPLSACGRAHSRGALSMRIDARRCRGGGGRGAHSSMSTAQFSPAQPSAHVQR